MRFHNVRFHGEFEPGQAIPYKIACAPSIYSDLTAHLCSLLGVFAVHSMGSLQADSDDSDQLLWMM